MILENVSNNLLFWLKPDRPFIFYNFDNISVKNTSIDPLRLKTNNELENGGLCPELDF